MQDHPPRHVLYQEQKEVKVDSSFAEQAKLKSKQLRLLQITNMPSYQTVEMLREVSLILACTCSFKTEQSCMAKMERSFKVEITFKLLDQY
jgi:hypothetical protein